MSFMGLLGSQWSLIPNSFSFFRYKFSILNRSLLDVNTQVPLFRSEAFVVTLYLVLPSYARWEASRSDDLTG